MKNLLLLFLFLLVSNLYAQKKVIGRVLDRNEQPIENVSILIKGATAGTTTNRFGYFEIEYKEDAELLAAYMGYDTLSFMLPKAEVFKFYMDRSLIELSEFDIRNFQEANKYPISEEKMAEFNRDLVAEGILDAEARFKGGVEGMYNYFGENFSVPQQSIDSVVNGLALVTFTVDKEGRTKNIRPSGETRFGIGEHITDMIAKMPVWRPAIHRGQVIEQDFILGMRVGSNVFLKVEEQPSFPGGMGAFYKYLKSNMVYPTKAKRMGVEGRVHTEFIIDKQGNVDPTSVRVIRGVDPELDAEAIRLISNSPQWLAGKQRGIPVRVKISLPVLFTLP